MLWHCDLTRFFCSIAKLTIAFFVWIVGVQAGQVTLRWDPNPDPALGGYRIYYGPASRNYSSVVDVGRTTIYTLYNLVDGRAYYFAATAYDSSGTAESGLSNEVSLTITPTVLSPNVNVLITHYYQRILGRTADSSGFAYWQGEITRSHGLGIDAQEAFRVMAGQFFASAEYLGRNTTDTQYVTDLYRTFFDRNPDSGGLSYWTGQLRAGLPRSVLMFSFLFSAEFASYMRGILGNTGSRGEVYAVVDFYRGFLDRMPDPNGFNYWLGRFRAAQCQGSSAVVAEVDSISRQFLASTEYFNRQRSNRDYVADLYYAFLRRGGDLNGFNYWVTQLNTGARNRDQVRRDFIQSPEFQSRVQQIIRAGCFS